MNVPQISDCGAQHEIMIASPSPGTFSHLKNYNKSTSKNYEASLEMQLISCNDRIMVGVYVCIGFIEFQTILYKLNTPYCTVPSKNFFHEVVIKC